MFVCIACIQELSGVEHALLITRSGLHFLLIIYCNVENVINNIIFGYFWYYKEASF